MKKPSQSDMKSFQKVIEYYENQITSGDSITIPIPLLQTSADLGLFIVRVNIQRASCTVNVGTSKKPCYKTFYKKD